MDTESRFCHNRGLSLLRTEQLTKTYQVGGQLVHALQDVDFVAAQGDFVVINGPSGSGKTTFLNLISAIDRATSGDVLIDGDAVSAQSEGQLARLRKSKIGLVFQSFNLIPVLSAAENVEYPLLLQKIDRAERKRRVQILLEEVDIADLGRRRPNELSGGQRQRVAIARALVSRPKLVLADEPTANLDSETGKRVMELMCTLNQEHCVTFIIVTHDPAVSAYAQRHVRILDGKIDERSDNAVAASTS